MSPSKESLESMLETHLARQRATLWWGMLAGGVCVLIAAQLLIVDPLRKDLDTMKARVAMLEGGVQKLVGTGDPISEANSLLGAIRRQRNQLPNAKLALRQIEGFHTDVEVAAANLGTAHASLNQVDIVHRRIIAQQPVIEEAQRVVADMHTLREAVEFVRDEIPMMRTAMNDVAEMQTEIANVGCEMTFVMETVEDIRRTFEMFVNRRGIEDGAGDAIGRLVVEANQRQARASAFATVKKWWQPKNDWIAEQWRKVDVVGRMRGNLRVLRDLVPSFRRVRRMAGDAWRSMLGKRKPLRIAEPLMAPRYERR